MAKFSIWNSVQRLIFSREGSGESLDSATDKFSTILTNKERGGYIYVWNTVQRHRYTVSTSFLYQDDVSNKKN